MPILDVEVVTGPGELLEAGLARRLADIAGDILGSERGGTWVKVRALPSGQYGENGDPEAEVRPVFVSILVRKRPPEETIRQQAERLSAAFAQACGRPRENVHILYEPSAAGRITFGGRLVSV